jgi:hypothetical protein
MTLHDPFDFFFSATITATYANVGSMYVGLDVDVVALHYAFNSCCCSAVTNFVVQAAVPKTAKVRLLPDLYSSIRP